MDHSENSFEDYRSVAALRERLNEAEMKIRDLDQRLARVVKLCNTLLISAQHQSGVSPSEFTALLTDSEKAQSEAVRCPKCGRVLERGQDHCIFCGSTHSLPVGKLV